MLQAHCTFIKPTCNSHSRTRPLALLFSTHTQKHAPNLSTLDPRKRGRLIFAGSRVRRQNLSWKAMSKIRMPAHRNQHPCPAKGGERDGEEPGAQVGEGKVNPTSEGPICRRGSGWGQRFGKLYVKALVLSP